jgi:hypothetical protein
MIEDALVNREDVDGDEWGSLPLGIQVDVWSERNLEMDVDGNADFRTRVKLF